MTDPMTRRPVRYGGRTDVSLSIVLDVVDINRAVTFWTAALGYIEVPTEDGAGPYRILLPADGDGLELLLQEVPEPKTVKNRMHFDLRVLDLDAEVTRLEQLGARRVTTEPFRNVGWTWHVLQDPDGNEFCVLRPGWDRDGLTK